MTKESKEQAYYMLVIPIMVCGFLISVPPKNFSPGLLLVLIAIVFILALEILVVKLLPTKEDTTGTTD